MYASTTDVDLFRKRRGLAKDYTVDRLLAVGTWDLYADRHHLPYLVAAIEKLGLSSNVERIPGEELGHAFEFNHSGKRYWFVPVMGTAIMSRYAHLACLLGSKKNILLGVAGGLAADIKTADLILPTCARGNESAFMYDRDSKGMLFYPDETLSNSLAHRLADQALHRGPIITCEAMFAETPQDIQDWSKEGYLGVEMESALMYALSKYFSIPSASILHIADNLIAGVSLFDKAHADSKTARRVARQRQYEAAAAELLDIAL